jgi:hypothetical protein
VTASIEKLMTERTRRLVSRYADKRLTFRASFLEALRVQLEETTRIRFPSPKYQQDPVGFFREILGVDPWEKQQEIIEAVRDNSRVAVKSGHKVSKSHTAAGIALWFYCSFEDARVVMSSTTARQVNQILWRELRMMRSRGGRCLACRTIEADGPRPCEHSTLIDGEIGDTAQTGLKSRDFREIVGFTAKEAEAVAGISGPRLLYIIDEASGVSDAIFEAIEGNRAGGAKIVYFSNPTRTDGEFFDAFNEKSRFYKNITISSEETPNVKQGRVVIPGLATKEWVDEKREEWGEDSPLYRVRIKGEFATREDGKIFSIHAIEQAEQRWTETAESGRLYIGLDPAGATGLGDESMYAVRRGLKCIGLFPFRGLSDEAHLTHLLDFITRYKLPRETPVVVLDREGSVGAGLFGVLRNYSELHKGSFEFVGLRSSDKAHRQPQVYDRIRDELAANLEMWMREGGAIPEDSKLAAELHFWEWKQQTSGRLKISPKDEARKYLGRSPDRYDALALSVWEPLSLRDDAPIVDNTRPSKAHDVFEPDAGLDPYAGMSAWEPQNRRFR